MLNEEEFGSDTDDDDYVPDGDTHAASEEDHSGDDETFEASNVNVKKKKKNKTSSKVPVGRANMFEVEEKIDWSKEREMEKQNLDEAAEKKKTEDIWADFKNDTESSKNLSKPKGSGSIAALFGNDKSNVNTEHSVVKPKNRFGSLFDKTDSNENGTDKTIKEPKIVKPKNRFGSLFDKEVDKEPNKDTGQAGSGPVVADGKVEITKVFDFAGEEVKVKEQVAADSKEAVKFLSGGSQTTKRSGGLAGVVGSISKKPKMGCLDKSKLDWNSYVEENNIREELKTHNKGKDGYVEKLEFLERADHRQFEQEKAIREKTRKSLMK